MHALTQVNITIHMDDAFTLNCRPTVPVGCKEQVADAKCTRPFLPSCEGAGTQTIWAMGTGILWMAMAASESPTMSQSHGWDDVEHSNWVIFMAAANTCMYVCM